MIESEKSEIYEFGMERILTNILNLTSMIVIGIAMQEFFACVIFCIAFKALRSYAGGYHARTQVRCYLLSMGVLILSLSAVKYMMMDTYTLSIITIWAAASICILAPIEAENKPLDIMERGVYRTKTWLICAVEVLVLVIGSGQHWDIVVKSIVCVLVVVAFSLIAGYVDLMKRRRII